MAKDTTRDRLWLYTLRRVEETGEPITATELSKMAGCSRHSARDLLNTMVEYGLLKPQHKGNGKRYVSDW